MEMRRAALTDEGEERERERERVSVDSSHVRLDARRQNVNLALTHYARSACAVSGVRYQ